MEENKKLEEVVYEVIKRFPGISRTHLVKLVYLTDREYFKKNGVTLTGVKYKLVLCGPTANAFGVVMEAFEEEGVISEVFYDGCYHIFPGRSLEPNPLEGDAMEAFESAVRQVTASGKLLPLNEVRGYVLSLSEVRDAGLFEEIVFKEVDEDSQS